MRNYSRTRGNSKKTSYRTPSTWRNRQVIKISRRKVGR